MSPCPLVPCAKLRIEARIQKRPILRPVVASPYTGSHQQKVVYVSSRTPFISTVKRVRKLLKEIDKRSMGKIDLVNSQVKDKQRLRKLVEKPAPLTSKKPEEVILKATNKAIENVLELALYFQGQDDCKVRLRTGTEGVVDDIVMPDLPADHDQTDNGKGEEDEEPPESRIRKLSVVEAAITLK